MELAGVGLPLGPIFQPRLVELTSPWPDITVEQEPFNSFMHITVSNPHSAVLDTAAQQMGSWARIFLGTRGPVAGVLTAFTLNTHLSEFRVYFQGHTDSR